MKTSFAGCTKGKYHPAEFSVRILCRRKIDNFKKRRNSCGESFIVLLIAYEVYASGEMLTGVWKPSAFRVVIESGIPGRRAPTMVGLVSGWNSTRPQTNCGNFE
jgi:hypothetical protein